MKILIPTAIILIMIGCTPVQKEEAIAQDSVATLPVDTLSTPATAAEKVGNEYIIQDGYSYIVDPFAFSLDSAAIKEILGEDAIITVVETPGGEDEDGTYSAYSYYEVTSPDAKMSFYSYSGKHYADVTTSKIPFRNGVAVGMLKSDFITAMNLPKEASKANTFTINDDYGSMSFDFDEEKLSRIYVNYEEGT
jgi:hypothetical protein